MRFKAPALKIEPNDPFASDALGRGESAETLTELLASLDESFVLAIDAPWGSGKTTFLRMWSEQLRQNGFRVVSFNAWESDFSESAIVSLLAELKSGIGDLLPPKHVDRLAKVMKVGFGLAKRVVPVATRLLTQGLVDVDLKGVDVGTGASQVAESLAQDATDWLAQYVNAKESIVDFREELGNLASDLATDGKPIVICVDELDRCRPSYAVDMLETVKHFFEAPNVVFVLALAREQLSHSVKSLYGADFDASGYLKRFIDLEYRLPDPERGKYLKVLLDRFEFREMLQQRQRADRGGSSDGELIEALEWLFELFQFQLRDQEQCLTRLGLIFRTTPANQDLRPYLLAPLLVIRERRMDLYEDYIRGRIDEKPLLEFMRKQPLGNEFFASPDSVLVELWLAFGAGDEERNPLDDYRRLVETTEVDTPESNRAGEIVRFIDTPGSQQFFRYGVRGKRAREFVAQKLAIADRFIST